MSDNANQAPGSVLTWDEVKDGASEIFNVWVLGSEMQWAERAWAMLEKAGLTTYRDAVEEPAADDEPEFTPAAIVMGWIMEGMPCR